MIPRPPKILYLGVLSAIVTLGCESARKDSSPSQNVEPARAPAKNELDPQLTLAGAEQNLLREAIWRARTGAVPRPAGGTSAEKTTAVEDQLARLLLAGSAARTWAAFGLGRTCSEHASAVEPLLVATSASWAAASAPPSEQELRTLGIAIGSCQSRRAEATLSAWLAPPPAADADFLIRAAAAGLGAVAESTGALTEGSLAALLDAAAARKDPFLLYPLSRLRNLPEAVSERLLEVAGSVLVEDRPGARVFAILALGAAESTFSAPALLQVLLSHNFSPTERAAAVQALTRLGEPGQKALDEAASALLAQGIPKEPRDGLWSPLRATLDGLDAPQRSAGELRKLAALPIAEKAEGSAATERRRLVWLRCRAADLLARDRTSSVTLSKCDPDAGPIFELSQVRVLARSRIELGRRQAWDERLKSPHPSVVQAALRLIASHVELGDVRAPLRQALTAAPAGTRATAAKILAAYPTRAHDPKHPESGPDPGIVASLRAILETTGERMPEETVAAAISAAAALSTLALKPLIEGHCRGERPALRAAAERALAMLGSTGQRCTGKVESERPPEAPQAEPALILEFPSDVGVLRLILDHPATDVARAWVKTRFESGELTRGPVHAVSPGFSIQFGDADGDGFDSDVPAPNTPLELGPWEFESGAVGLSSHAPGAFGNQLLVSLEPLPALYGRRVLLGRAEGPWHLLWPGDSVGPGRIVPQ